MNLEEKLDKNLYRVSKPERYIGSEWNQIKKEWDEVRTRVVLAFPDVYEIGMSHLGLKILYHLLNKRDDILCERVYAPWPDMEELMEKEEIPLFSLEGKHSVNKFDILAFTLQYEMGYTNIINMINLAGLPLYSNERNRDHPLVIGGGAVVYNPEPVAPFFDLFFIGEAETGIVNLVDKIKEYREEGLLREEMLRKLSNLPGVYIPSLYQIDYDNSGRISAITPADGIKEKIDRQIISDLDKAFYPTEFMVPYMDIVHDRATLEISRGCTRGCRFCVAGMSYRPVRERKISTLVDLADRILASTGYDEVSLTSLSTVDYSGIHDLIRILTERYQEKKVSISLSSLRVDEFSVELAREIQQVRKSGLTFAPEAGTDRLRKVINKGIKEDDLFQAAEAAFKAGWSSIKLYFMLGLPTETDEDVDGIVDLARRVLEIGRRIRQESNNRMKPIQIHVSVSTFIPKPFTPFQWVAMVDKEEILKKQDYLRKNLRGRGLKLSWDEPDLSVLEGIFARGDRRLAPVLETAWKLGARFDGWNELFRSDIWKKALQVNGINEQDYLTSRNTGDILPWAHINLGIKEGFLQKEYDRALNEEFTPDCRFKSCTGCDICFSLDSTMEIVGADNIVNQD